MVKTILLSLLCFVIIWVAFFLVDGILLNPYAGGEIHRITSYLPHLWREATFKVLAEYIVTISLLVSLLILGKYPSHWSIIAIEGAAIVAFESWHLRFFFHPLQEYIGWFVFCLMALTPALIIYIAWLVHRLKMVYEVW
jgi:hypothetical protein